jgi:hypothetical protein
LSLVFFGSYFGLQGLTVWGILSRIHRVEAILGAALETLIAGVLIFVAGVIFAFLFYSVVFVVVELPRRAAEILCNWFGDLMSFRGYLPFVEQACLDSRCEAISRDEIPVFYQGKIF